MTRAIISARKRAEASALVRGTVASRLSWKPWPCVILAIDPGARGGWAIGIEGRRIASGVAASAEQRTSAIALAVRLQTEVQPARFLVVAAEKWQRGGWRSFESIVGTGAAWGRWAEQLELIAFPATRIVRVVPKTWRAPTIGQVKGGREMQKRAATWRARGVFKLTAVEPDEAEALCIMEWASRAPEVLEVLPKKLRDELAPATSARGGAR